MTIFVATIIVERIGGLAFAAGLFTRFIGLFLALDVAGAIFFFHRGFFVPKGIEFVLMLMVSSITLAIGGPGAFSIDGLMGGRSESRR